jgi:hypothetical protein
VFDSVTKEDAIEEQGKQSSWFKLPFSGTAEKTSLRFSCFPTPGNGMSVLIEWSPGTTPVELLSITSAGEVFSF